MPNATTIPTYSYEEKASEAFKNYHIVNDHADQWKKEAKESGDIEMQVKLMGIEYEPKYWMDQYLMYKSFDIRERAGKVAYQLEAKKQDPNANTKTDLIETVLFIIENGAVKHVEKANNLLEELFTEVDYYDPEEEIELAEAA
jgi:hypothetical protein